MSEPFGQWIIVPRYVKAIRGLLATSGSRHSRRHDGAPDTSGLTR